MVLVDLRLEAGTKLGPYKIRALRGAGGIAAAFRAHDVRLCTPCDVQADRSLR